MHALEWVTEADEQTLKDMGIKKMEKLAKAEFDKYQGQGLSDYRLEKAISFATALATHV